MLDGWYCRSMANMQAEGEAATRGGGGPRGGAHVDEDYSSDSSQSEPEPINYRAQYNTLKKKLKYLIYENECFQESLRSSQKRLLKSCRDRTFLLDRLLQYEKPENSSSESDETDSSDDAESSRMEQTKKRRVEPAAVPGHGGTPNSSANVKSQNVIKRKRPPPPKKVIQNSAPLHQVTSAKALSLTSDGHMTPEEVERHLQSRQSFLELVPEKAPPTVPTEMFSNDPSLDSESNDLLETSPCNLGDDWVE